MEVRQVIMLGLMLAALVLQPTVVEGQQATTDTVFVGGERSAILSGVFEYFPTAGFAYAGDWKRGFLPNAFRVASYMEPLRPTTPLAAKVVPTLLKRPGS